jgi:uncharacterized protein
MSEEKTREDGWANLITSAGTSKDANEYGFFNSDKQIDRRQLVDLYRHDGYAKKIIDIPADEMTREWIEIQGDPDGLIINLMRKMKFRKSLNTLRKWSKLYGGAIMVMLIDDGGELNQPLRPGAVKNFVGCRVYDRWQVHWTNQLLTQDPLSNNFGYPEVYQITPYHSGSRFEVHHSRVIRMDGEELPEEDRLKNNGWGDSVFQAIYRKVRQFSVLEQNISSIIKDYQQLVITIDGLQNMIATGQEEFVKKRIEIMNLTRSVLNAVILDKEESFSKQSSSVAGLSDIMDRFALSLSGVTNIPASKLFGRAPAGLNSTGESDLTQFYDWIRSEQDDHFREPIEKMIQMMAPLVKLNPNELTLDFKELHTPTEAVLVDTRFKQAQIDNFYLMNGTLSQQEVRQSRFGGHKYSHDTALGEDFDDGFDPIDMQAINEGL